MNTPRRLVAADKRDDDVDASLRPQRLSEFIGQEQARANLKVFIEAARGRKEALDHVLFVGPPGLGKTTLAQIVARELGVNFRATSGPVIAKAGDLAALLTNLEPRDVLFIDEIHRLNPAVEEIEMICPDRCLRITGKTARVTCIGPIRLVCNCLSICSCVNSSKKPA